jgi:hypothetical protein
VSWSRLVCECRDTVYCNGPERSSEGKLKSAINVKIDLIRAAFAVLQRYLVRQSCVRTGNDELRRAFRCCTQRNSYRIYWMLSCIAAAGAGAIAALIWCTYIRNAPDDGDRGSIRVGGASPNPVLETGMRWALDVGRATHGIENFRDHRRPFTKETETSSVRHCDHAVSRYDSWGCAVRSRSTSFAKVCLSLV